MSDSEHVESGEEDPKYGKGDEKHVSEGEDGNISVPLVEQDSSDEESVDTHPLLIPIEEDVAGDEVEERREVESKPMKFTNEEDGEFEERVLNILTKPTEDELDIEDEESGGEEGDEPEEVVIEVKNLRSKNERENYESLSNQQDEEEYTYLNQGSSGEQISEDDVSDDVDDDDSLNENNINHRTEEEIHIPTETSVLRRRRDHERENELEEEEYEIIGESGRRHVDDDDDDDEEIDEDLEEKKKVKSVNPFGISPWYRKKDEKPVKDEKVSNLRGGMVRKIKNAIKLPPKILFLGNCVYVLFFGWYMSLIYILAGVLCYLSICCIPQGKVMFQLSYYFFWPFNKYVERTGNTKKRKENYRNMFSHASITFPCVREEVSIFAFQIIFAPALAICHVFCMTIAWFGIVTISISKLHFHGMKMMLLNPLKYRVRYLKRIHPGSHIYLCVFRTIRCSYIKYSVMGMNIFMLNMLPMIIITILLGLIDEEFAKKYAFLIFPLGLLSTIPLAYYIGKAVSSISSQSSFAVGAFFNALFGSLIELILYFIQLQKGLTGTVHKAVTGSLLGVMLLMPGLSMFIGGIKHRQQYFNKDAAGVSAVLLLLAISGVFVPTLFYQTIAEFGFRCQICTSNVTKINGGFDCTGCTYHSKADYVEDENFQDRAKPLTWVVAFILPVAYIAGLLFALKTHKHLYEKPVKTEDGDELEAGGHGGPGWSKLQCLFVLGASTGLFAAVAEVISITMEPGVEMVGISKEFAGLTLIGIVPNFAEFVNAIQFALENNIILSLEIGNVAALQISLLQTSALVLISQVLFGWIFTSKIDSVYYLIFPSMDIYALFLAVLVLNYVMIDGRANYFRGLVLVLVYLIFMAAYFFETQDLGGGSVSE